MADEILKEAVEPKKTLGWKAGIAAGWIAGASMVGGPAVVNEINESKAEAFADSVATVQLAKADVRRVEAKLNANGNKQEPFTKFNPMHYYQAGDSVSVMVRDAKTDSLMSRIVLVADESSLLAVKAHFVPSEEPKAPEVINEEIQ